MKLVIVIWYIQSDAWYLIAITDIFNQILAIWCWRNDPCKKILAKRSLHPDTFTSYKQPDTSNSNLILAASPFTWPLDLYHIVIILVFQSHPHPFVDYPTNLQPDTCILYLDVATLQLQNDTFYLILTTWYLQANFLNQILATWNLQYSIGTLI